MDLLQGAAYMAGTILFVLGLKNLSKVRTARKGNGLASLGMLLAVVAILEGTDTLSWGWILAGMVVGGGLGAWLARTVAMTAMPEMVALFNGFGGGASLLVAISVFWTDYVSMEVAEGMEWSAAGVLPDPLGATWAATILLSILVGSVTLTGSVVAMAKLSGRMPGRPLLLPMRHVIAVGVTAAAVLLGVLAGFSATGFGAGLLFVRMAVLSGVLGVLLVIPIGGADMPVVISLLNSYSGIAASMTGFVISNPMLISAGALVGASGLILTGLMCKAMNRSLLNVLVGGFGDTGGDAASREYENVKSASPEEAAMILESASSIIVIPGYGLAVAQAQHVVRELADALEARGATVRYAIHPVAGRMPGHMNVLLAEADVPYDQLYELERINGDFKNTEVVLIVGANDVVNPAAIEDPESPIAGMPILNAHEAHTVLMVKRSLSPGYAGIKNPLFERDNCLMCFGDGKEFLNSVVNELKD